MGLFPCSLCAARFRGPSQTVYPTVVIGRDRYGAHLRLCDSCMSQMLEDLTAKAVELSYNEGQDLELALCVACGEPCSEARSHTVFATVYKRGDDRQDFMGLAHPDCVGTLKDAWRLSAAA